MATLSRYDVVVSFGYRHILGPDVLRTLNRPAINLHIAYLPYNRGAHPNFWSWVEGTPSGVTIHEIDEGIDTGPICYQKRVESMASTDTFAATYSQLIEEIEDLFIENIDALLDGSYCPMPQVGAGSYHNASDLPEWMTSWDMKIDEAVKRFESGT